jgi:hypothetical protein
MKKSTKVRVSGPVINVDSNIYFDDGIYVAWVSPEYLSDHIQVDAFTTFLREIRDNEGSIDVVVRPHNLDRKVRDYYIIRLIVLLSRAREIGAYQKAAEFYGQLSTYRGGLAATSICKLMRLTYQYPECPGQPLYEVVQG